MEKKKKGEGLTGEDAQIFKFLREERQKREEKIRQDERKRGIVTKAIGEPIAARTRPMPSVFHVVKQKKKKTLQEVWEAEDQERKEYEEDEAERKRQQR